MKKKALIAGGGLAGLSAACELADRGWEVTLCEQRKRLGGMVASFLDAESGLEVDNGEHIAIAACTELLGFAKKLGVADRIRVQKKLRIPFVGPDGSVGFLTESAWSFLTFRFLSFGDRWRVAKAIRAIGKMKDAAIAALDRTTCAEWLQEDLGQTKEAIDRFWEAFVCPALNEPVSRASASLSARVLRDAMGRGPALARFGLFTSALGTVFNDAGVAYVTSRGGRVRSGVAIASVVTENGAIAGLKTSSGDLLSADAYVLALPHAELSTVFPESAPPLDHSPIVNAHLWYDRPVTDLEFGGLVDSPIHWFFNRTRIAGEPGPGQRLSFSISAARDWAHKPSAEIAAACDGEVKQRFPVNALLKRFVVVREHRATFAAVPGTQPLRPGPKTRYRNLFMAGAWTDTGYPATMEGAVRSGKAAAQLANAVSEAAAIREKASS